MRAHRVLGGLTTLALLAGSGCASRLHASPCTLPDVRSPLDCGFLEVPENRTRPNGRRIELHYLRARATASDRRPEPIVYLEGGPGASGIDAAAHMLRGIERAGPLRRDQIFFDQRGTGRSAPLDCVRYDLERDPDAFLELFAHGLFDVEQYRECLPELESRADLRQYTTTASAHDLDELRAALGYETLVLEGGSYGTRLGLEYLRRHGASVHVAVLRGVTPSSDLLTETVARDLEDGLDATIAACRADEACAAEFPDFEQNLATMLERARRGPIEVEVPHPVTGELEVVRLAFPELVLALRYALYSVHAAAGLPLQVRAAAEGDYGPLAGALAGSLHEIANVVYEGMWASVKCTEELPFVEEAARHLPNALLVAVSNRSHWGLGGDDCIDGIVDRFIEQGSGAGIDVSCAQEHERPPFVLAPP